MNLFVFGSSITSAYWNGAATYYRGLYRGLHRLGHHITFAEPDIYDRQKNRDLKEDPPYARVIVYTATRDLPELLKGAARADLVIKHSGIGADDTVLEEAVLSCRSRRTKVAFWDVDAPATLARVQTYPQDRFRQCIPQYDYVFTYGGGPPVVSAYEALGARRCYPIYNGLDPDIHHPTDPNPSYAGDLFFMGNRLPDREQRVEDLFLKSAEMRPENRFVLGGEGWSDKPLPPNVRYIGHCPTDWHNVLNCSSRFVLNIDRESMARWGYSPPTRIFEAAGAACPIITDAWEGVDAFFEPGKEILVASSANDVARFLSEITPEQARSIGLQARRRALDYHTYDQRAATVNRILRVEIV